LIHTQFHNDKEATRIELAEAGNGAYEFDQTNNTQTITFTKRPYTPLKVFQSLVKMAMCIMPDEEVNNYMNLIGFINSSKKKNVNYNISGALASIYLFPMHFGSDVPYLMLFKKRGQSVLAPTHVLRIVARNIFIEVKLPLASH
jgi:hypothetical protein